MPSSVDPSGASASPSPEAATIGVHWTPDALGGQLKESGMPTMEEIEADSIRRALARNDGSRKRAAQDLNISERTLYRKIEKFGL